MKFLQEIITSSCANQANEQKHQTYQKNDEDTDRSSGTDKQAITIRRQHSRQQSDKAKAASKQERQLEDLWQNLSDLEMRMPEFGETVSNLFNNLQQFSMETMLKSQQSLWKNQKNEKSLKLYLRTIENLGDRNFKIFVICSQQPNEEGTYLAVRQSSQAQCILLEASEIAVTYFEEREKFLQRFYARFSSGSRSQHLVCHQKQIICMYHQFVRMKKDLHCRIGSLSEKHARAQGRQRSEQLMRKFKRQLRVEKNKLRAGMGMADSG